MNNSYFNLIHQSYDFPQEGFDLNDDYLNFCGVSIKHLIEKYGTPFKFIYLPRIGQQIQKAKELFNEAIKANNYTGKYQYCYCTKCCHFPHVVRAVLKEEVNLETSSSFDLDLLFKLFQDGELDKNVFIIHNGYKTDEYLKKIIALNKKGFHNSILVLDSTNEIKKAKYYSEKHQVNLKIGIRIAIDEAPNSAYHTSRLGIRPEEIIDFYKDEIEDDQNLSLEMVHFFIDSGIKDNNYYWGEFHKALDQYVALKHLCKDLKALNIGGGFPIKNNLAFKYDYEYMINKIVQKIQSACNVSKIEEPDIFTEFGKYTVGESGAIIFKVLEQKKQNDKEVWYVVDNSLLNTIPDTWSILEKFIVLPINKWSNEYTKVNIGGISCDQSDYYNSEGVNQQLSLPTVDDNSDDPLYVGFFHTGAYQDSISGYGGIKHCLIPAPKHIIIDKDESGNLVDYVYQQEQSSDEILTILGYNKPA